MKTSFYRTGGGNDIVMLRLGVIGLSEGNGHPYSWSAIFNGYSPEHMASCPFTAIPQYLAKQVFPRDALQSAKVTHVWTNEESISRHIAAASLIPNVACSLEEMVDKIDAVLLARDDAETHYDLSLPFLQAGKAVFIDKPLEITLARAARILKNEVYEGQVFSCSALRFAEEFSLTEKDLMEIGTIHHIEAEFPKSWQKYAIHVLEPIVAMFPDRGKLVDVQSCMVLDTRNTIVTWTGLRAVIRNYSALPAEIVIRVFGDRSVKEMIFSDSFGAFKKSLRYFVEVIGGTKANIDRNETMEIVEIIERGNT
jgi:hypothetical protein